ncbi:TadE/TadG family type IV pilus assembly protein [Limimaricola soesokkakensis]|uniref:TadE/TadG family type IV pilus assembly protein n=1 Tax=Limimaricola soesokkakensis TaxID=1343159 RepID=UPI00351324E7
MDLVERMRSVLSTLRSSKNDDGGSATVEFVLWVPVAVFLLLLTVDAGQIFLKQAQATRMVQDANRALSVGKLRTTTATEALIKNNLAGFSSAVSTQTSVTAGIISTTTRIPLRDLAITKALPFGDGAAITIRSSHMMEF